MKASLSAADILNSWPEDEIGRILRDYGEESNWVHLQKQIVGARANRPFHCTKQLVKLIQKSTSVTRGMHALSHHLFCPMIRMLFLQN